MISAFARFIPRRGNPEGRLRFSGVSPQNDHFFFIASLMRAQDEPNARLPEQARWRYLTRSRLTAVSWKKMVFFISLGQNGWILASLLFCVFMDLDSVWVHKHVKKELGQYQAILTSCSVNNPHIASIANRR